MSIAPNVLISDLAGELKGSSSHEVNQRLGQGHKVLEWQVGYGVVSFGTKDLERGKSLYPQSEGAPCRQRVCDRLERLAEREKV